MFIIHRMQAGREMDKLIAREIFGLGIQVETMPAYSTDIAAAWEVIIRLRQQGFACRLFTYTGEAQIWSLDMPTHDPIARSITGSIHEMPLAICRAALLAVKE